MTQENNESDIVIALLYDGGQVGLLWRKFMEEMFTVNLPENYRDMRLDVECYGVNELTADTVSQINQCSWKLLLLSDAMLEEVKNPSYPPLRSEVLETNPDRVIILVLAEPGDTSFQDDIRRSLCVFRDFSKFHLINATSPETIFNDMIDIVSPLYIVFHPNILSSEDRDQHLTLIANKPYPVVENSTFLVQFDANRRVEVEARLFNPCTLLLENPGSLPTGMIDVRVYICVPQAQDDEIVQVPHQLGEVMKVWNQSDLDKLGSILEKNNNPFHFLCEALSVDPNDPRAVDVVDDQLTNSFRKHVPENQLARVFGTDQGYRPDAEEEQSREFAPTLLHFAAMHGLRNLTAQLLRCPGAVRAYGMANCEGDYPTSLAEKAGHWDLKDYMNSYMEVSAMVDYEMGSSRNTSEWMAQMVTGQFLSVNESIYDDHPQQESNAQPSYVAMRPLNKKTQYDTPFIFPIPSADNTPNYESILTQMIESEDTYMSFEEAGKSSFGFGYGKDPPPPPPRDSPPPDEHPALPPRLPSPDDPPLLPTHPSEKLDENASTVQRGGADRVSYKSLTIPKIHSYVSPAQRELITLQQKVKSGELTTNQAVIRFKEWERKHKEQAASFQFQQECLQRVRNSLIKSKELKRSRGEDDKIEITKPIIAGSSTYDLVLRKTNVADGMQPTESIYGVNQKPPKINDGFTRSPSRFSEPEESVHYRMSTKFNSDKRRPSMPRPRHDEFLVTRPPPVPPREPTPTPQFPIVPPRSVFN